MFVLTVTSARSYQHPSILLQHADDVPDLHRPKLCFPGILVNSGAFLAAATRIALGRKSVFRPGGMRTRIELGIWQGMRISQKLMAILLVLLLGATVYGLIRTTESTTVLPTNGKGKLSAAAQTPLVDQSPLRTAQKLVQLADNPEEQALSREAIRLAG